MKSKFYPLVSIIIPVYNGKNYMREAIDCALAQTYSNIEVLLVNDGSNDDGATHEIAMTYGDKIRYFQKKNGGVSTALNMGIANMRGDYFSWLSHDDLYTPDKIAKNVEAVRDDPLRIVYSDYDNTDAEIGYIGTVSAKRLHRAADYEFALFPLIKGLIHGCSLLIHKSLFEKFGTFDEDLKATQDYDLWFKMFRDQRLIYIPEPLVKARSHKGQTSHTSTKVLPEGEILWTNMLSSLTHEEMCAMNGSERNFWINQAYFMKNETPYAGAAEYAFERLKESTNILNGEKVSVIIPFYNRIDLVIESVKSVQQQTYQNLEILLINDGSTDDVREMELFIKSDSRIKYIKYKTNLGAAHARNTGLDVARGKFISFLDSDDRWEPQKLEKQIKFMLDNKYCISHTNYYRISADVKLLEEVDLSVFTGDIFSRYLYSCGVATPCVIVERDFLGDLRFPDKIDYGEDVCLWLELAWRGKWGHLSEPLTTVYVNGTSSSQSVLKQQLGYAEILRYILKHPDWATYQNEIRIMALDFVDLFPKPNILRAITDNPIAESKVNSNIFSRFLRALKRYGLIGTMKKMLEKLSRQ